MQKSEINACAVTLEVNGARNLFILLDAGGTVNRLGNGRSDSDTGALYVGATDKPLFAQLMSTVPGDLFQHAGSYADPVPRGLPCKLTIIFEGDSEAVSFEYEYGSESPGPPTEISELVVNAIELTDPYYIKRGRTGIIGQVTDAIKKLRR